MNDYSATTVPETRATVVAAGSRKSAVNNAAARIYEYYNVRPDINTHAVLLVTGVGGRGLRGRGPKSHEK